MDCAFFFVLGRIRTLPTSPSPSTSTSRSSTDVDVDMSSDALDRPTRFACIVDDVTFPMSLVSPHWMAFRPGTSYRPPTSASPWNHVGRPPKQRDLRRLSRVCQGGQETGIESARTVDGCVSLVQVFARRIGGGMGELISVSSCRRRRRDRLVLSRTHAWTRAGYYNPLLSYGEGEEQAVRDAKIAGANGFIVVDLPPEEAIRFRGVCTGEG